MRVLVACRRHRVRPVPDSNFSCWKVVANRALAPHLDYVEYDASLFGCQVCHVLRGGGGGSNVRGGGASHVKGGKPGHMIHKLQHCTKPPTTATGPLPLLTTAVNHQQMLRFSSTGFVLVFVTGDDPLGSG